jgi:XTP/dITP diphosphohydrolase
MILVLATRNRHKIGEIAALFSLPGVRLVGAQDYPDAPEVVEDGCTFEENAAKKAVTLARATGEWALADDSGLEVDALGGAPGIRSARYAGESAGDAGNVAKLLLSLAGAADRRARFRCVLALSDPKGNVRTIEGRCEGRIAGEPRGAGGFGYDPVFVPDGHRITFAEMDADEKNRLSHRARAFARARAEWSGILGVLEPVEADRRKRLA